jgi:predicted RNA-binding protein with PUA-like domain
MKSVQDYLPTQYWLMKSEPDVFSFENLLVKQSEFWDGVRNYQARNFMMNNMQVGHKVLFYHSNATPSGVAGVCEVIQSAMPDLKALDASSEYFDPKATKENPRWYAVTVGKPKVFSNFVSLAKMRDQKCLHEMLLLRKGQRLSILPLSQEEYLHILLLGGIS